MKFTQLYCPTLRESPAEAEIVSHQLLLRAGYIRKQASGLYVYLPLAHKVMKKINDIIRDEMNAADAQELLMPAVISGELWERSGRWNEYGKELLRFSDRHERAFCLGPTHEEVITNLVKDEVKSYKQLPLNLYQIQNKFRDEIRPRFGLMRAREFLMKDAYSFHDSLDCLAETYQKMNTAYHNIFRRCGLKFAAVSADGGNIGGDESAEFMVLAETGEDEVLTCGDYAANVEVCPTKGTGIKQIDINLERSFAEIEAIATPDQKTINEVATFFEVNQNQCLKSLLFEADKNLVLAVVSGDCDVNEIKLKKNLGASSLNLATDEQVMNLFGCEIGFIGPVAIKETIKVVLDHNVTIEKPFIVGANKTGIHLKNVQVGVDFKPDQITDIVFAKSGDACVHCNDESYKSERGIEVGHIFKLGDKYSKAMGANFLNKDGKLMPLIMGCYGIGVGRTMAAAIEQNHDEKGIKWPLSIAPFSVIITITTMKNDDLVKSANEFYDWAKSKKIDVIIDDRAVSAGVKFKDAELIGIPFNIVFGKGFLNDETIECKIRQDGSVKLFSMKNLQDYLLTQLKQWT